MAQKDLSKFKIITPRARLSYPNLFEASSMEDDKDKQFSATFLFPKTTNLRAPVIQKGKQISGSIRDALEAVAADKWGDKAPEIIARLKKLPKGWPIRLGNKAKPESPEYKDQYFIKATSKADKRPQILGLDNQLVPLDNIKEEFYAGCYVRAQLLAWATENKFGKFLGFNLQSIRKIGNGPKISGSADARETFGAIEEDAEGFDEENFDETEENGDDGLGF